MVSTKGKRNPVLAGFRQSVQKIKMTKGNKRHRPLVGGILKVSATIHWDKEVIAAAQRFELRVPDRRGLAIADSTSGGEEVGWSVVSRSPGEFGLESWSLRTWAGS